jgi:hypothetical protein
VEVIRPDELDDISSVENPCGTLFVAVIENVPPNSRSSR